MVSKIKYFVTGFVVAIALVCLVACAAQPVAAVYSESDSLQTQFVEVGSAEHYKVVYNSATRVMYTVSNGRYNGGTFTLLVNEDGTPMIWKG